MPTIKRIDWEAEAQKVLDPLMAQARKHLAGKLERAYEKGKRSQLAAAFEVVHGKCNICGLESEFKSEDRVFREALTCTHCKTTSRYRSIARGILRAIKELTGVESDSLAELTAAPVSIYDTQISFYEPFCRYPIPDDLTKLGHDVHTSIYRPTEPLGIGIGIDPKCTNQNIECLTYEDSSFDIVITSDLMEHVRLDYQAHQEIRRVLRNGGVYLFTVPHWRKDDPITRVIIHDPLDPTKDEFVMEREYHGDINAEDNRSLSYRVYGKDLDQQLTGLGFKVDYCKNDFPEMGIVDTELFYCILTK